MAIFVWLEGGMQMKEEWKSAAMECGELSLVQDGIAVMLLLLVGSVVYISPTQVCPL